MLDAINKVKFTFLIHSLVTLITRGVHINIPLHYSSPVAYLSLPLGASSPMARTLYRCLYFTDVSGRATPLAAEEGSRWREDGIFGELILIVAGDVERREGSVEEGGVAASLITHFRWREPLLKVCSGGERGGGREREREREGERGRERKEEEGGGVGMSSLSHRHS